MKNKHGIDTSEKIKEKKVDLVEKKAALKRQEDKIIQVKREM